MFPVKNYILKLQDGTYIADIQSRILMYAKPANTGKEIKEEITSIMVDKKYPQVFKSLGSRPHNHIEERAKTLKEFTGQNVEYIII